MASIKVAVRVRPLNRREVDLESQFIIQMNGKKTSILNTKIPENVGHFQGDVGRERIKDFTFDHSYWTVDRNEPTYHCQKQVFEDLGRDVISSGFEGYNGCIFAYGQTGSGKTYTMMGTQDDPGLIPRICEGLFEKMEVNQDEGTTYRTEVSYLEIYNEHVRDLLRKHADHTLRVREHPKEGPYVQDLSKHLVINYTDIKELMDRGNAHRTTASTNMNDTSSRSHAIFTIKFVQAKFLKDMPSETQSKIHLVDLAGSERADATGATGQRLKEGASINKSLVTLGNVISTLADISDKKNKSGHHAFIPYRDSVLTWLLKDSLGGNSKTVMIATISPADVNYAETLSALRYANRAKNIINKPTVNEDPNVKLIRELRAEIERLKAMLGGNLDNITSPLVQERLHESEARVKVLTDEWAGKWKEVQHILQDETLALRKVQGLGVVLDSELPHLIGLDDDILSTGIMLFHLKEGPTRIGRAGADLKQDIELTGLEIQPEHCIIEHRHGAVTLKPLSDSTCIVNGISVQEPVKLYQGAVILLGQTNMFRFNHPAEAARLRAEHNKGNFFPRSLSHTSSLSQSMTSLAKSTDNLALFSTGLELEKRHMEEMEKLEEKRLLIEEMEEKYQFAEEARLAEQLGKEQEMERKRSELRNMQEEMEKLKLENEKAKLHIKTEEKRLKRRSMDLEKQFQVYQEQKNMFETEREIQLANFQEQKEKEKEAFEKERLALQQDKQDLEKVIEQEVNRLQDLERQHKTAVEEAKEELAKELERVLQEQEKQRQLNENEKTRLELEERLQMEKLKQMKQEINSKRVRFKEDTAKEVLNVECEREILENHRKELKDARRAFQEFEESARKSLQIEKQRLQELFLELDLKEKNIAEKYEENENQLIVKREKDWNELCNERDKLEMYRKTLGCREQDLKQILDMQDSGDNNQKTIIESEQASIHEERQRLDNMDEVLNNREKEFEDVLEQAMSDLNDQKQKELQEIISKREQVKETERAFVENTEDEISSRRVKLEQEESKVISEEPQLTELEESFQDSFAKASQEKSELEQMKDQLAEKVKQQEETAKLAYEKIHRKQSVLEKEAEEEEDKIERQRKRLSDLEKMHEALNTQADMSSDSVPDQLSAEWQMFEERLKSLKQLEEQYMHSEAELKEKQTKFEEERQSELDRIEMEKFKLQEMEDQERINGLVEIEVKRRLFEEKVQREKQRRMEREREKVEREKELERIRRAHDREIQKLKQRYEENSSPASFKANPYASVSSKSCEFLASNRSCSVMPLVENAVIDITIPSYTLRGNGADTHHEFEVKITIGHESWMVFRRYKRFREVHNYMKTKYPEVNALNFPPKKLFGNRSEKVVKERRGQLENYIRQFIETVQKNPNCPLNPTQNKLLSKQLLCDFSAFFRKGIFETSKHSTA